MNINPILIIINVCAIILAPIIAIQVSQWLSRKQEAENRKMDIFRKLMVTRATGLSPTHVQALNGIDIEFSEKDEKTKAVYDAWKELRDHFNVAANIETEDEVGWKNWAETRENFLAELLHKMSIRMGFNFNKVDIKRGHYYPKGYGDIESEQMIIRQGFAKIFKNEAFFPIMAWVAPPPSSPGKEEKRANNGK